MLAREALTNWAGNIAYSTERIHEASTVEEIRSHLRSEDKLKVLGTRHCFNSIADSHHNLLALKPMQEITLDAASATVTVGAGVKYGQLGPYLDAKGFACTIWLRYRISRLRVRAARRRMGRAR
jgi:alditol oxidase